MLSTTVTLEDCNILLFSNHRVLLVVPNALSRMRGYFVAASRKFFMERELSVFLGLLSIRRLHGEMADKRRRSFTCEMHSSLSDEFIKYSFICKYLSYL